MRPAAVVSCATRASRTPARQCIRATWKARCRAGASQGIGWALNEEYIYDDKGVMANAGFLDYRMPVASDLPMIDAVIVEVPHPGHPCGVRGVGEMHRLPPLAAVCQRDVECHRPPLHGAADVAALACSHVCSRAACRSHFGHSGSPTPKACVDHHRRAAGARTGGRADRTISGLLHELNISPSRSTARFDPMRPMSRSRRKARSTCPQIAGGWSTGALAPMSQASRLDTHLFSRNAVTRTMPASLLARAAAGDRR